MTMQAFYINLFEAPAETAFQGFVRIARAGLKEILAVRSELSWDIWTESK